MALPTIITVTGTLLKTDGTPEKGHVFFYLGETVLSNDTDTVVVPSVIVKALDNAGKFTVELPASDDPDWTPEGWTYKVVVHLSKSKYSFSTVIPFDAPDGEIPFSELLPALDGGSELYAAYNHTHPGGGGSTAWTDITGKPSTFPPSTHTHTVSQITDLDYPVDSVAGKTGVVTLVKADVGLGNVDNTSDATKPVSTATQTALNGKAASVHTHSISDVTSLQGSLDSKASQTDLDSLDDRVVDLENAGGGSGVTPTFARGYKTSGDVTPGVTASFTQVTGMSFAIPAVSGDNVEVTVSGLLNQGATDFFELVVMNGSSIVRYGSTGTSSPTAIAEGDPAIYPLSGATLKSVTAKFSLQASPGDLNGGNITFGLAFKGSGSGKVFASTNYPLRYVVTNYKQ